MLVLAEKILTLVCFTTVLIKFLCFELINDANAHHGLQEPLMTISQMLCHVCGPKTFDLLQTEKNPIMFIIGIAPKTEIKWLQNIPRHEFSQTANRKCELSQVYQENNVCVFLFMEIILCHFQQK